MKCKIDIKRYIEYFVFLIVGMFLILRPIGDMDEIWNYNFGYNVCNGLLPYSDFNCIITPLSTYISGLFLFVFGDNLFSFRILGILLLSLTFYILFRLLWACAKNRALAFAFSSFAFALCYIIWIYNYNNLNLFFILLALLLEFNIDENNGQNSLLSHFFVGFIYGAIFSSKHSIGALFLIYNACVCLISWIKNRPKRKFALIRLLSSGILPLIFVLNLIFTKSFMAFWDYAIAGIRTFSVRITYWDFITSSIINFFVGIIPIVLTLISLTAIKKGKSNVSRRFHIRSLIISWIGAFVAYPLCDSIHMNIAIIPFVVSVFCCFGSIKLSRKESLVCVLVSVMILLVLGSSEIKTTDDYKKCELNNYEGLFIECGLEKNIKEVNNYILSKDDEMDVLIVDSYASAYLLPLDKYYKDFSLLNQGNIGTKSVSQLLWRENAIYLVASNRSALNYQSHFELIEYIVNNYTKIGEVSGFEIYEKK